MNIKDFKVLLDKRVYHNLEGQWRDLFNRLKWDTVKSALKSVAGLQGRKFKVLPSCLLPMVDQSSHASGASASFCHMYPKVMIRHCSSPPRLQLAHGLPCSPCLLRS